MAKVEILPDNVIDQIAAGEVVEDPSSVVKELIENAIDAKSSKITIRLQDGGYSLLTVEDDGEGMDREDARRALLRHATSKLREASDLSHLITMGFRGEALASIAAVSKMELSTSSEDGKGVTICSEEEKSIQEKLSARPKGTTVSVRALFYNLPARMRFQKSPASSVTKIIRLLSAFSFIYTDIQFLLFQKGDLLFSSYCHPEKDPLKKISIRMREILGKETFEKMLPVEYVKDNYRITGYIGVAGYGKKNRLGQYLFVNKRWVFSPFLSRHIKEIYHTSLAKEEHPFFVLSLEVPPHAVDVNVHPQKKEIRFQDNLFISTIFEEALRKKILPSVISSTPANYQVFPWEEPTEKVEETFSLPLAEEKMVQPVLFSSRKKVIGKIAFFLLVQEEERFFLANSISLCETMTQALFAKKIKNPPMQSLLFPISLSLSREQMAKAWEKKALFVQMQLSLTWNKDTIKVHSIPSWMDERSFTSYFLAFLEEKPIRQVRYLPSFSLAKWEEILSILPDKELTEIGEKECMMLWEKRGL